MNHSHLSVSHGKNYVILSFLGLFIHVVLVNAWVTDDAYITFRVVDNFVNGYGLTWNVTERVQVFTNPLWLFIHIPFYFVTSGIADERGVYVATNGLLNYLRITPTNHGAAEIGIKLNKRSKEVSSPLIEIEGAVGMRGFYAGPRVVIIDRFTLTDPLLARLPITRAPEDSWTTDGWRIGHFNRLIPQGYLEFHQTGSFEQMSKTLAEYYKPLHFIISGPLFDLDRLQTIWRFNLGEYDHYLQEYSKINIK